VMHFAGRCREGDERADAPSAAKRIRSATPAIAVVIRRLGIWRRP
jgi:hypothetical protein